MNTLDHVVELNGTRFRERSRVRKITNLAELREECVGQRHEVRVVRVGHVELTARELRVVTWIYTFVPQQK